MCCVIRFSDCRNYRNTMQCDYRVFDLQFQSAMSRRHLEATENFAMLRFNYTLQGGL